MTEAFHGKSLLWKSAYIENSHPCFTRDEHFHGKEGVSGSSPEGGSSLLECGW